ncbi:MAG: type II toxin-antitoxin system RelE/ParE family toxin [Patescibacteria group bacterium]
MKKFQFQFSSYGEKDFSSLARSLQKRILSKLEYFEKSGNPLLFAKKLVGLDNKYRFRVGDYRIIISKQDSKTLIILLILKIRHRKKIYE